jgi:TetR/AcrR family tetracycline transcriptional repressor
MALARSTIVAEALRLLDEVGFDGLSTRLLATRLGIKGPSLYWHFKNKRDLLNHMSEAMLAEALPSPQAPGRWDAWLGEGARGIRRVALARRDGARVIAGSRPTGASTDLDLDAMIGRLTDAGFSRPIAVAAILARGRYAIGWAIDEQAAALPATPGRERAFEVGLKALLTGFEAHRKAEGRLGTKAGAGESA